MSQPADCPDCTAAKVGPWGGFRLSCHGCTARAIARSPQAFDALDRRGSGDRRPLGSMVDTLMADVPRDEAVKMVREWVRIGKEQRCGD